MMFYRYVWCSFNFGGRSIRQASHDLVLTFPLSQFNFYDHTKLIIASSGLHVSYIDRQNNITRHKLSELMMTSLAPSRLTPDERKSHERLVSKLKYCKEVINSIRMAGTTPAVGGSGNGNGGGGASSAQTQEENEMAVSAALAGSTRRSLR